MYLFPFIFIVLLGTSGVCLGLFLFSFQFSPAFAVVNVMLLGPIGSFYAIACIASFPTFIEAPYVGRGHGLFQTAENMYIYLTNWGASLILDTPDPWVRVTFLLLVLTHVFSSICVSE
jgi:hypothetical protein